MSNFSSERTLQLGRLGRTVGLDGGLLFHAAGPAEAALLQVGLELDIDGHGPLTIRDWRRHNRGHVVFFEGIRRVETARTLTNAAVSVAASLLPEGVQLGDFRDGLAGLPVLLDGRQIGRVVRVSGVSGFEFLELEPDGQLIPLNAPYVGIAGDSIVLTDPPAGLV